MFSTKIDGRKLFCCFVKERFLYWFKILIKTLIVIKEKERKIKILGKFYLKKIHLYIVTYNIFTKIDVAILWPRPLLQELFSFSKCFFRDCKLSIQMNSIKSTNCILAQSSKQQGETSLKQKLWMPRIYLSPSNHS